MSEASLHEKASVESLVAHVADEFLERQKNGEKPDIEEYAARHPEATDLLRKVLVALELIGQSRLHVAGLSETTAEPADTLGDFRIVREVGRGGMGVVYEAEQISLRRRVALKVLPFAATMDPRHLQRFYNEAQAAACLHHTNIVPVFFVGSERGVHFYAMQFIDGRPLSEIIRQLRRWGSQAESGNQMGTAEEQTVAYQPAPDETDSTPLPAAVTLLTGQGRRSRDYFRKVAELGVQAAEALDHAHQLGIVHRDIKPGNLLLDGRSNVWVTDFGLAYMQHSEANLTVTGQAVGTPRYMSPEQTLAKRVPIDHRTDLYSLGATLYELLTLQPAFTSEDRHELLRRIAFEEPPRPRRLERTIPSELEIIVLKAMEKRPQDRYATAQELADDLRRWLNDEPIRARRPGWVQRATKWGRRHRPLVFALAVSLFLALIVLSISNAVIWNEQQTTKEALNRARILQAAMDRQMAREVRFREEFEVKLQRSMETMDDVLAVIDKPFPDEEIKAARLRQAISERGMKFYRELLPIETRRPSLIWETMWAYVRLGNLYVWGNQFAEANKAYDKACQTAREWVRLTHERLEPAISPSGEVPERSADEKAYRRALAHWRKKAPEGFESVCDDFRIILVEIERPLNRGIDGSDPPDPKALAAYYGKLMRVFERVLEDAPSSGHAVNFVFRVLNYGNALQEAGRVDDEKAVYREAVKLVEKTFARLPVIKEGRPEVQTALHQARFQCTNQITHELMKISSRLDELNAPKEAESAIRVSLSLFRQCVGETDWVRNCERLVAVEGKLFALLSGQRQPADSVECLGLAYLSQEYRKRYAAAANFYRDAFSKEPRRAGDLNNQHRYNAACAAARAGCGHGKDADQLAVKERARLRQQALDWLRADLTAYRQLLEKSAGKAGPAIAQRMQHWLQDGDFAGVRGDEALAQLPQEERKQWLKLWQEAEALRQRTEQTPKTASSPLP